MVKKNQQYELLNPYAHDIDVLTLNVIDEWYSGYKSRGYVFGVVSTDGNPDLNNDEKDRRILLTQLDKNDKWSIEEWL